MDILGLTDPLATGTAVSAGLPMEPETTPAPAASADPFAGMSVPAVSGSGAAQGIADMTELRRWEDKHERELEEIARKEEAEKKEKRQAAEAQLREWYETRDAEIKKRHASNVAEEQEANQRQSEATKEVENPWERVAKLINTSARTADESRDTSRMANLLISLKSNPVAVAS
uniref:Clathrin light chain n=1 Tax=Pyrodinium bahamense TaxID=73915 RepID=A0A7S0AVG4_9DINO|mmetsp:Transcript_429/g.1141  ORF Transcript_429/g.1141 Transcript_429/m.1141 type:complete len:173 (+) Transcript_429:90-608(+)